MIGQTISHYKILEKLGEGGMGVVYKATDLKLDRTVALKFLPPDLTRDPRAKKRFVNEAKTASALQHHNICTIHEIDETRDGHLFISMDCYEGEMLKEMIVKGPLPVQEAIDIIIQVAEGLSEAHAAGMVHRDIKPANIMVTRNGVVKILDFGLAKLAGQIRITKTGMTVGTVAYMSPEQAQGVEVDRRTDIWALGVMLYEMLTGQLPFKGEHEQAVVYRIINEEPETVTGLRGSVPMALERIVSKAIAKDLNERYQNSIEILIALRSLSKELESGVLKGQNSKTKVVPSIAVLPFVDMSPQKDHEYFCEGIAEELINALTHLQDLHVVARTSAFSFKDKSLDVREIGKKLNVEHVLEGSVRKAGDKVRITAQLVNVVDGYQLWSEKYDRDMEDIFAIQEEISLTIADNLKVKLWRGEKTAILKRYTDNLEAYNLYLKGIYFSRMYTAERFREAIEYFERALDKDPNYALAYYGLAEVFYTMSYWGNVAPNKAYPTAKAYVKKALELDDTLGDAHAALGLVYAFYDWNWKLAEGELKQALQLNPNSAIINMSHSWFLSLTERHGEAIIEAKRAQVLDPLSDFVNAHVGLACIWGNQYDTAIKELQMTLTMNPNFYLANYYLGLAYQGKSMTEEAIAQFEKAVDLGSGTPWPEMILATSYFESGNKARGEKLLESLKRRAKHEYIPPLGFFYIHLARGEADKALDWLEKACEQHDSFLPWCSVIPIDRYRIPDEPGFKALLRKAGLR
ncbi:MAG: protein kinase [Candidatus Latescibacteria bacterium]|nr:protein kinase [Candidatus Latescibacterota bacterium]NIO57393.1 protein kinase [Candidatus Latescibacterota bacterium]